MPTRAATPNQQLARMMTHYMAWANRVMLDSVARVPSEEITRERPTLFGNIAHTFNHVFVVADMFRAHLEGRPHDYTARNIETAPATPSGWSCVGTALASASARTESRSSWT